MRSMKITQNEIEKRLNLYGVALGELTELVDFGIFDPFYVVLNFLVCDGDFHRKERNILLAKISNT